jgi:hypothetical protein
MRKGQDKAIPLHLTQAQKGGDRKGVGGQRQVPAELTPTKRASTLQMGEWVDIGLVWMGPENLAPTGVQPRTIQPLASNYNIPGAPFFSRKQKVKCNVNN